MQRKKLSIHLQVTHCLRAVQHDAIKNKLDCYRREDCMERFFKDLRDHAITIINHQKKRNDTTDR